MQKRFDLAIHAIGPFHLGRDFPDIGQEPHHADNRVILPRFGAIKRPHIHLIGPESVDGVLIADFLRRDTVFVSFAHLARHGRQLLIGFGVERHLLAIDIAHFNIMDVDINAAGIGIGIGRNHALVKQLLERLGCADIAKVKQDLVPETRVQKMQHRMFRAANIKVDCTRKGVAVLVRAVCPIGGGIIGCKLGIILGIEIAQIIPARPRPVRHGVGIAFERAHFIFRTVMGVFGANFCIHRQN